MLRYAILAAAMLGLAATKAEAGGDRAEDEYRLNVA